MKQMVKFLSHGIRSALRHVNMEKVYELRLRAEKPLFINYFGVYRMLGEKGLTDKVENAYIVRQDEIEDAVFQAGDCSVYSVEEQLRRGFLTTEKGVRIGLAGRYVFEKGQPLTVRDITSLCIRIPHEIEGVGGSVYERCLRNNSYRSILLLSLPGRGKTTALRELCRLLCEKEGKNVLVCDERGELDFGDLGTRADVLSFADKKTAFEVGIRTLRPDVIVTDELTEEDISAVKRAIFAGVNVLASAHVESKERGERLYGDLFDYYVLFKKEVVGQIDKIYDKEWKEIAW
ncbi:MAG: hypothetical protein IKM16_03160 [Clostridia bacterium]|nr:hypothetical protein [Clostridia bacterium]